MPIEIKKSQNPVKYEDAISFMEDRLKDIDLKKVDDLIWVLEHDHIYTSGTSYKENEIIDKSINIIKTNRGGKITYHGPGQLICYFVIDLKKGKKDIRKFISVIEKSIIETLSLYDIETFADKENIGIWYNDNSTIKKVAAIGVRVSKWIAYHGFSININNDLKKYNASVMASMNVKKNNVSRWGIYKLKTKINKNNYLISDVIEKPSVKKAPSNKAVIGRYILPREIFSKLLKQKPGKGGEIHITDAIQKLIQNDKKFIAHNFSGKYLDCGSMSGYIKSTLEIAKS